MGWPAACGPEIEGIGLRLTLLCHDASKAKAGAPKAKLPLNPVNQMGRGEVLYLTKSRNLFEPTWIYGLESKIC